MGKVKTLPDYPRGLDFEQVWAGLMELRESQKETDRIVKETDRIVKEYAKEQAERQKETDRQMKDFNKRFGEFTNRFGEVVEYMIAPNLVERFWDLGLKFLTSTQNFVVSNHDRKIVLESDFFLENGDKAMLVEVKTKLTMKDVKEHEMRLENMRAYADSRGDKRVFLGAVAGVVMTPNVKNYALNQGFFVVEPAGETFNITPPNGPPKEW